VQSLSTMSASSDPNPKPDQLHAQAEERLRSDPEELARKSPKQMQAVIHELHVHQIELEMQNEQLRVAQEEIESARERYAGLYDFAPIGYLTVSKAGIILRANLTSVSMLGVERSRLISLPLSRFVLPTDQDSYYLTWRKIFENQSSQSCELRLCPTGASVFFARLEGVRAEERGEVVCQMTISDVTEQKRAEQALRESELRQVEYEAEEWKRLALDAGELAAWTQDLQSGRITCSGRGYAMLGFSENSTIDWESVVCRVHPEDRSAFLREVERSGHAGGSRRCESVFRLVLPGCPVRWLRFIARTFFSTGLNPLALRRTGVLVDITRQKEIEQMLESRAKQLEGLVQERTLKLQEVVTELEHFSYTLVHDLRAPLRSIEGFSGLLSGKSQNLTPQQKNFLERAGNAARRMDRLITDALNYNRIVRQDFSLEAVDAAQLLQELIDSYPQFQEARTLISVVTPVPVVMANRALLTQCFSNFLSNALKFIPPGKTPSVRIFAQEERERVRIWFDDNGIGISQEGQRKLFRMFQRLSHNYEGTGIGLALVKKAAHRMRGEVGVESEPGFGSRFWVELNKAPSKN
jgi:PAS domain S-box-containing protein